MLSAPILPTENGPRVPKVHRAKAGQTTASVLAKGRVDLAELCRQQRLSMVRLEVPAPAETGSSAPAGVSLTGPCLVMAIDYKMQGTPSFCPGFAFFRSTA